MFLLLRCTGVALRSAISLTLVARLASLDQPVAPRMRFAFSPFVPRAMTNLWLIDTFGYHALHARLFERHASEWIWYVAALVPLPTILCAGLSLLAHSLDPGLELDKPVET